jgi:hypothetical protein
MVEVEVEVAVEVEVEVEVEAVVEVVEVGDLFVQFQLLKNF